MAERSLQQSPGQRRLAALANPAAGVASPSAATASLGVGGEEEGMDEVLGLGGLGLGLVEEGEGGSDRGVDPVTAEAIREARRRRAVRGEEGEAPGPAPAMGF